MNRWLRLGVTAGLAAAYLVLLIAAVAALAPLFLVAAIVVVVTELALTRFAPYLLPEALNLILGPRFRVLSLDVLTALLAARLLPDGGPVVALAIVAVLMLAAGRDLAGVFARRVNWRLAGGPVSWRGFTVPGLPVPRPLRRTNEPDAPLTFLTLLIPLGYAIGSFSDRFGAAVVAQWIVIAVVVLALGGRAVQYLVLNRRSNDATREAVRAAIEGLAPEVVLHHSGRRGTVVEQVLIWVPALKALDRPCLIVVREITHLEALADCGVPVVWAPRSQDVELFTVGSVDLALYPSDATNINNHLLRVPGVYDVLIGHGDSDEPESRSPVARMYDEVWVAGPAGRERYAYPTSGVPAAKVKAIGPVRPGFAGGPRVAERRPAVVYAPTWENVLDAVDLSSLLTSGAEVLDALLARQDVRVLFVPAPPTGSRVPAFAEAERRLRAMVAAARSDAATLPAERLREALAEASFAVVDVSPRLAEAVRADVPFAVPALPGLTDEAMLERFPSVAGGTVLRSYPEDVFAALDDAFGADATAAARLDVGRAIDASGDFTSRFRSAVDDAIAAQRRRRAFARPGL